MNVEDLVDANLVEEEMKRISERMLTQREGYFWPSESSVRYEAAPGIVDAIGACRRKVFWRWKRMPPTNPSDPRSLRTMAMGKAIEQQELEWYFKYGFGIARNFKFQDPKLRLSGEGDALVFDPNAGIVGVEIKSIYGYYAEKEILGTKGKPGFPRLDNLMQAMLYIMVTKIPQWRLVYIARTTFEHRQFAIGMDEHGFPIVEDRDSGMSTTFKGFSVYDVLDRNEELYGMIARDELPTREYQCAYPADEVEKRFTNGLISKTSYGEWKKAPQAHPIGDWQCNPRYCLHYSRCQEASGTGTDPAGNSV